jgi:hypothetical protein
MRLMVTRCSSSRFTVALMLVCAGTKSQRRESNGLILENREKTIKADSKYRYDTAKRVRSHFERCKVSSSFHNMRRSFGSNRASEGTSIYKIAVWLGDKIEVVQRSYGHLIPQDDEINKGV